VTAKVRAFTLAFIVAVSVLAVGGAGVVGTAAAANAPQPVDLDTSDLAGEGTDSSPYEITNASELQAMEDDLGANYTLASDVDASETKDWNGGKGFEPVGENGPDDRFTGTFDGDNHTISDLYIDRDRNYVGLFGFAFRGKIEHVGLENADVTGNDQVGGLVGFNSVEIIDSSVNGTVKGTTDVGGLAGGTGGDIIDSSFNGTVKGTDGVGGLVGTQTGDITNSYATGTVDGGIEYVGGLVGLGYGGDVIDSYATATVNGGEAVGGLVGGTIGDITDSYATGTVDGGNSVGGLVGGTNGDITDSYATGTVDGGQNVGGLAGGTYGSSHVTQSYATGEANGSDYIGGLVGKVTDDSVVNESYATGEVTGTNNVGGLVGVTTDRGEVNNAYWDTESTNRLASAGGEGLTTAQMTGANASADGNMDGFDFENTWYLTAEYPSLSSPFAGEGTEAEPYEIEDVFDLQEMRKNLSASYRLTNDIDASETRNWNSGAGFEPVGYYDSGSDNVFTGTFDGDDHRISDLYLDRDTEDYIGLFGLASGAEFERVGLENVEISADDYVGGLAGSNNDGGVTETYVTGTINGRNAVGGLIGRNLGANVTDSYATGTVDGEDDVGGLVGRSGIDANIIDSHATVAVNGERRVGGLVGWVSGSSTVIDSHATGDVNGTENVGGLVGNNDGSDVTESHATGGVNGTNYIGGLVGDNEYGGKVADSYATGTVDGTDYVGGLVGNNDGSDVTTSYATGAVDGTNSIGGLVGDNSGTVEDAYWDREVTGQDDSAGGGTALSTEEMTGADAEANMFDFGNTWAVVDELEDGDRAVSYPYLVDNRQDTAPGLQTIEVYSGGNGIEGDPYEIEMWDHLDNVRLNLDAHYELIGDLGPETAGYRTHVADPSGGFEPIGDDGAEFTGSFDGGGHEIADLQIDRNRNYVGLFGQSEGSVTNVTLRNVSVAGSESVGGLVGYSFDGRVAESTVTGTVDGSDDSVGGVVGFASGSVSNVSAHVSVTGTGRYVGGAVGSNYGTVSNSSARGVVNSTGKYAGGLVGESANQAIITDSFATANVTSTQGAGGLVGRNFGAVETSFAVGTVTGGPETGGLLGSHSGTVTDSYWNVNTTTQTVGIGDSTDSGVTGLATHQMQRFAPPRYMPEFFDGTGTWTLTDGYPALGWQNQPGPTVGALAATDTSTRFGVTGTITVTATAGGTPVGEGVTVAVVDNGGLADLATGATAVTDENGRAALRFQARDGGDYEVALAWEDDTTVSDTATVTIADVTAPTADASNSDTAGVVGAPMDFDATNSTDNGQIASYEWDFDDGTTTTGNTASHAFNDTGSYTVQLRVVDGNGNTDTDTLTVTVEPTAAHTVSAPNETATAGIPGRVTVTAIDASGNVQTDENITIAGTDGLGGLTVGETNRTNDTGRVAFTFLENSSGTYTVDIAVDADPTVNTTANVTIERAAVTSITVSLAEDSLTVGESTTLTANATFINGTTLGRTETANLSSNDSSVATVGANGTVIAEGAGSTTLKADLAGEHDTVGVSISNPAGGGSSSSSGGGASLRTDDDKGNIDIQTNEDGSVTASFSASAGEPTSVDLGDSLNDIESGTGYDRVTLTFDQDTDGRFEARLPSRDELPDGTPRLGDDAGGPASTGDSASDDDSGTDRVISSIEFTTSSNGVDASDRPRSVTIAFGVSTDTLDDRGLDADDVTLNRYDGADGEWTELDTKPVKESDGEVTYEATTTGFSYFAVGERIQTGGDGDETTPSRPTTTPPATPTDTPTDSRVTTQETNTPTDSRVTTQETETTAADGPGFGIITALVALLSVTLFRRRRT